MGGMFKPKMPPMPPMPRPQKIEAPPVQRIAVKQDPGVEARAQARKRASARGSRQRTLMAVKRNRVASRSVNQVGSSGQKLGA